MVGAERDVEMQMNRGNIDRGMRRKGRDGFAGKQINNKQNDSGTTLEGEAALLEEENGGGRSAEGGKEEGCTRCTG